MAMGVAGSTRIEVSAHTSELGSWRAAHRRAEPRLRDYVPGYFASEGSLPRPLQERHLPSLEAAIVLNFAAPHRIIDPSHPERTEGHSKAWIVPLQHRHHIHEACGARDFMVIRLAPIAAEMLLGTPMARLPEEFGCSRRHLIAQFHRYFGMAPKSIGRISRFQLAVAAVERAARRSSAPYEEGKPYLDCQAGTVGAASVTPIRWQIWRSVAVTTTSPISSMSSGLFPD
jgi:AraC-like DNA-binding protein